RATFLRFRPCTLRVRCAVRPGERSDVHPRDDRRPRSPPAERRGSRTHLLAQRRDALEARRKSPASPIVITAHDEACEIAGPPGKSERNAEDENRADDEPGGARLVGGGVQRSKTQSHGGSAWPARGRAAVALMMCRRMRWCRVHRVPRA